MDDKNNSFNNQFDNIETISMDEPINHNETITDSTVSENDIQAQMLSPFETLNPQQNDYIQNNQYSNQNMYQTNSNTSSEMNVFNQNIAAQNYPQENQTAQYVTSQNNESFNMSSNNITQSTQNIYPQDNLNSTN